MKNRAEGQEKQSNKLTLFIDRTLTKLGFSMRTKLLIIFLLVKIIPLIILTIIAWHQFAVLGDTLRTISVNDSTDALNKSATQNIERMTTDTANDVANFLYERDDDIRFLANINSSDGLYDFYKSFSDDHLGRVIESGEWRLSADGQSWVEVNPGIPFEEGGLSTNEENDERDGWHYRPAETFKYKEIPLYDEIAFIGLDGIEQVKYVSPDSTKQYYPLDPTLQDISHRENTYVKAESYFEKLQSLSPGEIYVSDVIGAYVGSNYLGMYTPDVVAQAAADREYDIEYDPANQAYAGGENPNGKRFEGIIRWATPATDEEGNIIGYVTFALNHDHIMEFVDHITPMNERYVELPSAFEGNYAFIWDYKCRNICHPRHNSIVGYDPETGDPQVPWLETSIYDAWQASGKPYAEFIQDVPTFDNQSREKKPAAALTKAGLVGLDGRYLNNAPQCTGWMDLSKEGGSGSFYILWSGLYKLTTVAAIPYYTGQYAPSIDNDFSERGFGVVTIGAGIDDFTAPATRTEERLTSAISEGLWNTSLQLIITTIIIVILVIFIAIWMASFITNNITYLINGISRFRAGERWFRFRSESADEFATLANSFDDMADSIEESVKSPLAIVGMDLKIIYMNDYGIQLNETERDAVIGREYFEYSRYRAGTKYDPIKALKDGTEAEIFYMEHAQIYIKGTASYLYDSQGEKIGYIIITTDVTEMVNKQIELEQAVEDANRATEHKSEFLARMSHEIRTPMNAIIGITNIVQRKLDDIGGNITALNETKEHLDQIETSSQHLLGLLNDILDISKIEAGKIELTDEATDIKKFAESIIGIIKPRTEEKNIEFITDFDEFDPGTFMFDSLRLRQVVINLLGNAVKFTPELGTIEFKISNNGRKDGKTLVGFSIKDSGIGIPDSVKKTIFEAFEQGGGKVTKKFGGTGLGLAISKRIVELFGGDIIVESTVGEGSTFSFEIYLTETTSILQEDSIFLNMANTFIGKKLLLVDDVEINRMIVMSLLEDTGLEIVEASDGDEALQLFKKSDEGTYHIILMDIQMPVMNGYEATSAIRELEREDAATVPIVALTANAFKEDIDKAIAQGMNAHLAKPIEMEKLIEILHRYLRLGKNS